MKKINLLFSLLFLATMCVFVTSCEQEGLISNNPPSANPILDAQFRNYEIIEIDHAVIWNSTVSDANEPMEIEMRAAAPNSTISDWKFKQMNRVETHAEEPDFYLLGADGNPTKLELSETRLFEGQLNNSTDQAFMSISQDYFWAEVVENGNDYVIESLSDYIGDAKPNEYIKYNMQDIIIEETHVCHSTGSNEAYDSSGNNDEDIDIQERLPQCSRVEVSALVDYRLYNQRFNSDAEKVANWVRKRIVKLSRIYYRQNNFRLNFNLSSGLIEVTPTVTDTDNSLQMLNHWKSTYNTSPSVYHRNDINIIFTGRYSYDGGATFGRAYQSVICKDSNKRSYALIAYKSAAKVNAITAHEVGHILGATHTSGGMMGFNFETNMRQRTKEEIFRRLLFGGNSCMTDVNCN